MKAVILMIWNDFSCSRVTFPSFVVYAVAEEEVGKAATETRGEVDSNKEGFGRCSASGCYCKAFEGRGQTCRNCGHAYRKHY